MQLLNQEKIKQFATQLEGLTAPSDAYQTALQPFLTYAADFLGQFSTLYADFSPRADGNINCTMQDYIHPRQRVAYIIESDTGFIRPVDKDVQRGGKYQDL